MRERVSQNDPANKRLFSHWRVTAGLIRLLGDDWIERLALDRLERLPSEHIGEDLRTRLEDMPWWAPFKEGAEHPDARAVFHIEFQSQVDAHMPERLLEYAVMLRRDLLRSGTALARKGEAPASVSVVVYDGRQPWTTPRTVEARTAWASPALAAWQPRFAYRLVDARRFAGDHALDGNIARAVLALDAAPEHQLPAALGRVLELLGEVDDPSLSQSFELWCNGVLRPRFGDQLPNVARLMEEPTMLAETLREWEERKISEGVQRGREEERQLLRGMVARRFDGATAEAIRPLLGSLHDAARLAEVGALIVECKSGMELLDRTRNLAEPK